MYINTKKVLLVSLSLSIFLASCAAPTLEQQNQDKIIKEIMNNSLNITIPDRGAVSGFITTVNNATINNQEIKIQVVREVDIAKTDSTGKLLDTTGKEFKDPKTQTQAFLEKKGDVIARETIRNTDRFLITNLRPGDVTVVANINNEQLESRAVITVGKVSEINKIQVGSTIKEAKRTSLNITGKVVRPDGTAVANAKVSDVTGGFVNNSVITNADGLFFLQTNPFTTPRSLEATLGEQTSSTTVNSDNIENITIPLLTNSRVVTGTILNSVIKDRPVSGITVRVEGQNISTQTDANGKFSLRGVPVNPITLQVGEVKGYINSKISVPPSQNSNLTEIGSTFIRPIGNVSFNLTADNSPLAYTDEQQRLVISRTRGQSKFLTPTITSKNDAGESIQTQLPYSYVPYNTNADGSIAYEYINSNVFTTSLTGTIQFEGTDIVKEFTYPVTPKRKITLYSTDTVNGLIVGVSKDIEVYTLNQQVSIPINDIPGGEYSVSMTLPFHQTQKGIKIVVPSNDTISSELVQMRLVQSVSSIGDIIGKIIIKDVLGNVIPIPSGSELRVAAISNEEENLISNRMEKLLTDTTLSFDLSKASSDGSYTLKNVPTGTRIVVAGIITEGKLDAGFMPNSYVLLNVNSGDINKAPEMTIVKRTVQ